MAERIITLLKNGQVTCDQSCRDGSGIFVYSARVGDKRFCHAPRSLKNDDGEAYPCAIATRQIKKK